MLRKYAGGYHAKSVLGCYVLTVSGALMMLLVVCFCNIPLEIMLVVWGIAGIIIVLFAPVQNRNKILDEVEHLVYRRRAIIIWILESMLMRLLYSKSYGLSLPQCYRKYARKEYLLFAKSKKWLYSAFRKKVYLRWQNCIGCCNTFKMGSMLFV